MESERLVGILLLSKSNEILTEWTINLRNSAALNIAMVFGKVEFSITSVISDDMFCTHTAKISASIKLSPKISMDGSIEPPK